MEGFNKTQLPNAEDVENVLRDKCKAAGAESVVDDLKVSNDFRLTISQINQIDDWFHIMLAFRN